MKSKSCFYIAALTSVMTLVCMQPSVWPDDSVNVRISPSLPLAANQRAGSTLLLPVTVRDKTGKETEIRKFALPKNATRLLLFSSEVLSVSFSGDKVMETSAVDARTVAITGKGVGTTQLVISVPRHAGDTLGKPVFFEVEIIQYSVPGRNAVAATSRVLVPVDAGKMSHILGRKWPDGNKSFEQMLIEEIRKRDERIKELEKQVKEASSSHSGG